MLDENLHVVNICQISFKLNIIYYLFNLLIYYLCIILYQKT